MLLGSTPNDGSQTVTIPTGTIQNATARIKIVSTNSNTAEFFDISDSNFIVTAPTNCPATNAIFPSTRDGNWNDIFLWDCRGRLPSITDSVQIVLGHVVTLNINASAKKMIVLGKLIFQAGKILSY